MPVYDLTYRAFDGEARRRFRWSVIVAQELRILAKVRPFLILLMFPLFHFVLRVLQVAAYDTLTATPNSYVAVVLRQATVFAVNERTGFDFVRVQGIFVFVLFLLAGSGMLCNDLRHNLLEVYFSKPLTWRDYVLGKIVTLMGLGLLLTAVPGTILVLLHNLLKPGWDTVRDTWWWPLGITAFSLAVVTPAALGTLAFSALFRSERYAALALVLVLIWDWIMATVMAQILVNRTYLLLSLPTAINRVGEALMLQRRPAIDLPLTPAVVMVVATCLVALWVVVGKARKAEGGT